MKTIEKIITSIILALAFPFVMEAQSTTILYDFKCDGLCFRKISDNSVAICPESITEVSDGQVAYQGNNDFYSNQLPTTVYDEEYNYYSVVAIDSHAFENANIMAVVIPDSYNNIGEYAFNGCNDLKYVVIGSYTGGFSDSDITLEQGAFYNTPNLSSVFLCDRYSQKIILDIKDGADAFSKNVSDRRNDFKIFAARPSSSSIETWYNYIIYKYGNFEKCSLVYNGESQIPLPNFICDIEGFKTTLGQIEPTWDSSKDVGSYSGISTISFLAGAPYNLNFSVRQEFNYSITPATLTISTPHFTREYGQPNPDIEITVFGYVGNDNEAIFATPPMIVNGMDSQWPALPDEASNVGEYPIYVMADQNYPQNYEINYEGGAISVVPTSQSITWNQYFDDIFMGNEIELTATSTSGLSVSYTSSDPGIAEIEGNIVKFINSGEVSITASQNGNDNYHSAEPITKTVLVNLPQENELSLNVPEANLKTGENFQLIIEDYEWTSSDERIATVSESGLVTAIADGEVVITLSRRSDGATLATCKIKVDFVSSTSELSIKKGIEIDCNGNEVRIKGASASSTAWIYDMNGHTVYSGLNRTIHLESGIYIVSIEDSQLKVVIK